MRVQGFERIGYAPNNAHTTEVMETVLASVRELPGLHVPDIGYNDVTIQGFASEAELIADISSEAAKGVPNGLVPGGKRYVLLS